MSKLFIIEPQEAAQTDVIAKGVELAKLLNKEPQVFAYCYESLPQTVVYEEAEQQILAHKKRQMAEKMQRMGAEDVPVNVTWYKYLCEHAVNYSKENDFDLIVKGMCESDHMLPTDWHLLRTTKVPVMLLTENPLNQGSGVLLALDLDTIKPEKLRLNEQILQQGRQLAEATGSELHVAHIVRVPKIIRDLEVLNMQQLVKEAYQRHQTLLDDLGLDKEQIHIICGDPAQCLYQLTCRLRSQYLVMGACQRQGLMGWVIGNTAEAILHHIRCNVLVIPTTS
ncbi:universal stress protein UspA [Shewanella mangrovi]|uniref:Universal stress protein UspA n=1 Tax=Shewanella mangrovi TaxID=1515746 RepID=A0A094JC24_9GAMM|nr:universal stress protein [Shewanella mangrovi]KFZ37440.1 universal stress protein UspA [Shewanella mangrovi]